MNAGTIVLLIGFLILLIYSLTITIVFLPKLLFLLDVQKGFVRTMGRGSKYLQQPIIETQPNFTSSFDKKLALYGSKLLHNFEIASATQEQFEHGKEFESVQMFGLNDIGCCLKAQNNIWILFRGTLTKKEFKLDFDYEQVDNVHRGFVSIFMTCSSLIKTLQPNQNIMIFGHSLGAAITTLLVKECQQFQKLIGYSFGSPRVGSNVFASTFPHSKMFNIMNSDDIVTTLPLPVMPTFKKPYQTMDFVHVGEILSFSLNWGFYIPNHLLPIYQFYLNQLP